jgi:hypothetical protein
VYKLNLNTWLWACGSLGAARPGEPSVGGLPVADTEDRQIAVLQDSDGANFPPGQAWPCHADQQKVQGIGPERPHPLIGSVGPTHLRRRQKGLFAPRGAAARRPPGGWVIKVWLLVVQYCTTCPAITPLC